MRAVGQRIGSGTESGRSSASVPPSTKSSDPQLNLASGPSRNSRNAATTSALALRRTGTRKASTKAPINASSRAAWSIGVSTASGAPSSTVLTAVAHDAAGAVTTTQRPRGQEGGVVENSAT